MAHKGNKYHIGWIVAGIVALALFLFFFCVQPYHLFHREQTQLFLWASEPLIDYLLHPAALSRLAGDFLTQFFYYEGGGALILSLVLTLWGVVVYFFLRYFIGRWAWIAALLAVAWETGRQCGLDYPLSGTLSLIGIVSFLLFLRFIWKRPCHRDNTSVAHLVVSSPGHFFITLFVVVCGYWLFGVGEWSRLYNLPDPRREHLLALDTEAYFGRKEKLQKLVEKEGYNSAFTSFYRNLNYARQGKLPEQLMQLYQPAAEGLFPSVGPGHTYLTIYAANELWFELGDMTLAEHAAILGMIFSPRHTGARAIKRLAEINLINGDEAAAMKYLRLLQKTLCYRDWAEKRIPGKQPPEVQQWIERKRRLLPTEDTLRSANVVSFSLRHLLRSHPDNSEACDYLLCFDLLNKDIRTFAEDYQTFYAKHTPVRLYAEALLIYLAGKKASAEEVQAYHIPPSVVNEFNDYTQRYEANGGNGTALKAKYGKSYWFYFHYAVMNKQ